MVLLRSLGGFISLVGFNYECRFFSGRVDEIIVMDEGRVKRDVISIECDCGEFEV